MMFDEITGERIDIPPPGSKQAPPGVYSLMPGTPVGVGIGAGGMMPGGGGEFSGIPGVATGAKPYFPDPSAGLVKQTTPGGAPPFGTPGTGFGEWGSTTQAAGFNLMPLVLPALSGLAGWLAGGGLGGGGNGNGSGGSTAMNGVGSILQGSGILGDVPEPANYMVKKRWETYSGKGGNIKVNFYQLNEMAGRYAGYIMYYNNTTGSWGAYKPKKNIVLSSNPRLKDLKKFKKVYDKTAKMVAAYAPKKKVVYGQVPSRLLSAAEKKLVKA